MLGSRDPIRSIEPVWHFGRPAIPPRAIIISLAALIVPLVATIFREAAGEYELLLWLLALVPAFLLAYYRGWWGVATALALGMVFFTLAQVVVAWTGTAFSNWTLLLGVTITYLAIALGIGFLSDALHRARAEAEEMALTDELTGVPNRRYARLFLETEFAAAQRGRPLVVAMFDLDRFKDFNDRFGHQAGDEALRTFANVLRNSTRRMNLSARYGGEEFLSIVSSTDVPGALIFAERVRRIFAESQSTAEPLSVSAGLAPYDPRVGSVDELVAAADDALYQAKRDGRDCVRVFAYPPLAESAAGEVESAHRREGD